MIDALTRLFTVRMVFQTSAVSLIVAGSLRSMRHSAENLLQNSIQAGMGLATVVAGICEALGNSAIFLAPFSRAAAAVINSMMAPTPAMLNPSTRHSRPELRPLNSQHCPAVIVVTIC